MIIIQGLDQSQLDAIVEFAIAELEADRNYQSEVTEVNDIHDAIKFCKDNGHDWRNMFAYE